MAIPVNRNDRLQTGSIPTGPIPRRAHRLALLGLPVYLLVAFSPFWLVYGLGKLLDFPFSYDPRTISGRLAPVVIPLPLVGAALATWLTEGTAGLRTFFARAFSWRISPVWYFAAALTPFAVIAFTAAYDVLSAGASIPQRWFAPKFGLPFMTFFLLYIGIGEEVGWRGYLQPRFQAAFGGLGGGVLVGVVWALWHLPLFLMPGSFQYGTSLPMFVYLLVCWSVLMAWFGHGARGSVWVAILFHGAVNFIAFALRYPGSYTFIVWGLAALVAVPFLPRPLLTLPGVRSSGPPFPRFGRR